MPQKVYISKGLEVILSAKSYCLYVGKEYEEKAFNPLIRRYLSKGCERLVIYINGKPVSGLQIMINPYDAIVANVFTKSRSRKMGYARQLWEEAKIHHPLLLHSMNRSELGAVFAQHCK